MITAQGYQESKLNQAERSKSGAVGIMQIKPSTARKPDIAIDGIEKSPDRNIEAGNKYLRFLITKYINDPGSTPGIGPFSPLRIWSRCAGTVANLSTTPDKQVASALTAWVWLCRPILNR
jgi:Transglycosylase SLT domain